MNKNNIKYFIKNNKQYAEWADRTLNDDDRYKDDSIIIKVSIIDNNEFFNYKKLNSLLSTKYDKWVKGTRY